MKKNPAAVALALARAAKLSPDHRKEIAQKAAAARVAGKSEAERKAMTVAATAARKRKAKNKGA